MAFYPQGDNGALYWAVRLAITNGGYGLPLMSTALVPAPKTGRDGLVCFGCKSPVPWPCEDFTNLAELMQVEIPS